MQTQGNAMLMVRRNHSLSDRLKAIAERMIAARHFPLQLLAEPQRSSRLFFSLEQGNQGNALVLICVPTEPTYTITG